MTKEVFPEIICPYCNKKITLDEAFTHSLEDKIRKEIEQDAYKKATESIETEMKDLQEQLKEKDEKLKKAQDEELKLRKKQRELEDKEKNIDLELEREIDKERKKIAEAAFKKAEQEHELKDKETQKQIDDLTKQIAEWKRKAEQRSQKIQGEVLELELEQILKDNFHHDKIEAVSSGVRGADIIQRVCTKSGQICGTILLESKNAKNWHKTWIKKLRNDQREAKADVAILVTTILPDGIDNFDFREGIVIAHYTTVIPVIVLLRNQIHEIARTRNFNVDMTEKKQILYNYLTSIEFRQKFEAVVEAFANMVNDLQKERTSMEKTWNKREKQIKQALLGLANMYGGMQGILGSSLPEIKSLNMPELLTESKKSSVDKK